MEIATVQCADGRKHISCSDTYNRQIEMCVEQDQILLSFKDKDSSVIRRITKKDLEALLKELYENN